MSHLVIDGDLGKVFFRLVVSWTPATVIMFILKSADGFTYVNQSCMQPSVKACEVPQFFIQIGDLLLEVQLSDSNLLSVPLVVSGTLNISLDHRGVCRAGVLGTDICDLVVRFYFWKGSFNLIWSLVDEFNEAASLNLHDFGIFLSHWRLITVDSPTHEVKDLRVFICPLACVLA